MAEPQRKRRIESEIQRVLAELVTREVKDPRVGNVTITAVAVDADMGSARVYFTPFASRPPPEEVQTGLVHAGGFLRGEVGRRLRLRHAPRLEFIVDDTFDRASRLTTLIDRAVQADAAGHADAESGDQQPSGGDGATASNPAPARDDDRM